MSAPIQLPMNTFDLSFSVISVHLILYQLNAFVLPRSRLGYHQSSSVALSSKEPKSFNCTGGSGDTSCFQLDSQKYSYEIAVHSNLILSFSDSQAMSRLQKMKVGTVSNSVQHD
jgi:hypothetical protein